MRQYPGYQESQEGWIGDVPSHWRLERMKFSLNEIGKRYDDQLSAGAISFGRVVTKDADEIPVETRATYQVVREGEYLINPINLNYDLKSLRTALSSINVCVSPAYIVLQANVDKIDPVFGSYALHLFDVRHMKTLGAGVRQTITFRDIGDCFWPLPPRDEQVAIAAFLDHETGKIDDLIAEQEQLITLLDEKRQAVISHAVTKGLDPDVEMKDSGIEWLGEVPAHWVVAQLRHYVDCCDGKRIPLNAEQRGERQGDVPYWGANCIVDYVDEAIFNETIILLGEDGAPFFDRNRDVAFLVKGPIWPNNHVHVLRPHAPSNAEFLVYALNVMDYADVIEGSTRDKLTQGNMMGIRLPIPPAEEQDDIISYLSPRLRLLRDLKNDGFIQVSLLKERRSALISAAVTGKIDVRNHPAAVAALNENKDN